MPPGIPDLDLPGLGGGGMPQRPSVPEPPDLADMDNRIAEPEPETPVYEPVEDLLRLQTRVWSDPSDPGFRYFKVQLVRNGIEALPVMPREVVYLIDCSASMTEEKLQLALRGVRAAMDRLDERDVFRILAFRNTVSHMHPDPLPATVIPRARARTFLSELHAHGKTDVFESLQSLLDLPAVPGRPLVVMLVTDGVPTQGVRDTREILERFTRSNQGRLSVFALGGGEKVNRILLDFLGYRNRGRARVTPQQKGIPDAIVQMARETGRPVLADLDYRFTGGQRLEVYPRQLSHLYLDSPLVLVGRVPAEEARIGFQVVGTSVSGKHDLVFEVDLDSAPVGTADLRREWAWQVLLENLSGAAAMRAGFRADLWAERYGLNVPSAYLEPSADRVP
jgi:uncharacterized protein YegL